MIVVLNGAPRAGKSSIAAAMQEMLDGVWINLGVDVSRANDAALRSSRESGCAPASRTTRPRRSSPSLYAALWESVAAHERLGLNVAVDVGLHEPAIAADGARNGSRTFRC